MNPWHDVDINLDKKKRTLTGIVEISKGSKNKYELDKESGLLKLDRILSSSVHYPANYGFIPQTYCDDKDPLDILILAQEPILSMALVTIKPIGMLKMMDNNEEDDKIIAVHAHDPEYNSYSDISKLPKHKLTELKQFFEDYKRLEKKKVNINKFFGHEEAWDTVLRSIELYNKSFRGE